MHRQFEKKHIIQCILPRGIPLVYPYSTPSLPLESRGTSGVPLGVPLLSPINCKQALQCLGVRRHRLKFANSYVFSPNARKISNRNIKHIYKHIQTNTGYY